MISYENIHQCIHVSVQTAKDHLLVVFHAFKIDRNAIRVTGVKSVQKNVKPIFKRSSNDWKKQIISVGLIRSTLFNFFVNILTGQKRDVTKLKLLWPVNMTGHGPKNILSPVN